jgi:DNA polymerase (family 10)
MTDRYVAAVDSGVVHCLGHPLGRIIGQRDPLPLDLDRLFDACREHQVCIEINAQPDRLDLPDTHVKRAREAGVTFTLGTDAHKISDLDFMALGVGVARRGWLEKKDILNTRTARQLRKRLKK